MRTPTTALLLAAAAVGARLLLVAGPLLPDEVGYLLVAAHARPHGPFLYGDLWVDRPPLLVGLFAAADAAAPLVGDPVLALRLLAAAGVGLLVLAACAAGARLGGRRGSLVAGVVAGALSTTPLLGAPAADGEVLAVPLIMTSIALALRVLGPARSGAGPRTVRARGPAWDASAGELAVMCGAGAAAGAAALVKQNLVDAGVFVVAAVLVAALTRTATWSRAAALLAATASGVALAVGAALVWAAAWGTGPVGVYEALVGFRSASLDVIATHRVANPVQRAWLLAGVAVLTALVPLVGLLLVRVLREGARRRVDPVGVALVATVVWGVFSVAAGGSYWTHYLVELVPVAALGAAWLVGATGQGSPSPRERRAGRRTLVAVPVLVALAAVSALGATVVVASGATRPALADAGCTPDATADAAVAAWLRDRAEPGDDAVTAYGGVSVLAGTDLRPAYPYLWSLPVRTLDPHLDTLTAAVSGPGRATWVVRTLPLHSFGLDPDRRFAATLADGYRQVHQVCGVRVLLRDDASRPAR